MSIFDIFRKKNTVNNFDFYDSFANWIDEEVAKCDLHKVIAFNFNLSENDIDKWSVTLIGTRVYRENDSDWIQSVSFNTYDNPYIIEYNGNHEVVSDMFIKAILKYIENGTLREKLKSRAAIGISYLDKDVKILYRKKVEKEDPSTLCFSYVSEMPREIISEIIGEAKAANDNFRFVNRRDTQSVIEQICQKTEDYSNGKKLPKAYADIEDVAVALGSRFAYAYIWERNWDWAMIGDKKDTAQVAIVSPERNYCIFPLTLLLGVLKDENENNLLLLWNMTKDADSKPANKKYTPLSVPTKTNK